MTFDPRKQLGSEPEPTDLIEYAGPVYALCAAVGLMLLGLLIWSV